MSCAGVTVLAEMRSLNFTLTKKKQYSEGITCRPHLCFRTSRTKTNQSYIQCARFDTHFTQMLSLDFGITTNETGEMNGNSHEWIMSDVLLIRHKLGLQIDAELWCPIFTLANWLHYSTKSLAVRTSFALPGPRRIDVAFKGHAPAYAPIVLLFKDLLHTNVVARFRNRTVSNLPGLEAKWRRSSPSCWLTPFLLDYR